MSGQLILEDTLPVEDSEMDCEESKVEEDGEEDEADHPGSHVLPQPAKPHLKITMYYCSQPWFVSTLMSPASRQRSAAVAAPAYSTMNSPTNLVLIVKERAVPSPASRNHQPAVNSAVCIGSYYPNHQPTDHQTTSWLQPVLLYLDSPESEEGEVGEGDAEDERLVQQDEPAEVGKPLQRSVSVWSAQWSGVPCRAV